MHFQTTVHNWTQALIKMPDYTLLKSVNDPAILLDGLNKWTAAGRDPSKLFLDFRYHDFYYPDFDGRDNTKTYEEYKDIWRMNFAKFVDGTYYERYAPYIMLVEGLNEYTDTRMVTDKALLAPRIRSARSAVWVWNNEYRGKNGIPADARLVVCNSPVGNDIPIEYFQLCRDEDAVLGVRTYTHWVDKVRDPGDFRWHSGRPFFNEQAYGIKVDYVLGESGPYDGSTRGGWRSSSCMGGSRELLAAGMKAWFEDMATTNAYAEGRILGPGAWFTCNTSDSGQWGEFLLWDTELHLIAEAAAEVWKPGEGEPPTEPPEPPEPPVEDDLNQHLWSVSLEVQTIELNPDAALQQAIYGIDYVPVGSETWTGFEGDSYAIQPAEDLGGKPRLVAVAKVPDWDNVYFISDPAVSHEIVDVVDELPKHDTLEYKTRPLTDITTITIHHTVSACDRSTAAIARYHVAADENRNKSEWPGIGYHFVIGCDGLIEQVNYLETRSFHAGVRGHPEGQYNNYYTVGIALKDSFQDHPPSTAALEAARWLVAELQSQLGPLIIKGHKDMPGADTACPGKTSPDWFPYVAGYVDG